MSSGDVDGIKLDASLWAQEISRAAGIGPLQLVAHCETKEEARDIAREKHRSLIEPDSDRGDPWAAYAILGDTVVRYVIGSPADDDYECGPKFPRMWW